MHLNRKMPVYRDVFCVIINQMRILPSHWWIYRAVISTIHGYDVDKTIEIHKLIELFMVILIIVMSHQMSVSIDSQQCIRSSCEPCKII